MVETLGSAGLPQSLGSLDIYAEKGTSEPG